MTAWCAIVLPLLSITMVASASVEHVALFIGATTSVGFAVARLDGALSCYPVEAARRVVTDRPAVENARPTSTPRAIATIVVVVVVSVRSP